MTAALLRLWIYDYLARLFDGDVEGLPEPPDAAGSSAEVSTAAQAIRTAVARASAENVSTDHTRLFVNARNGVIAPPYASWYLDKQLLGPSTRWVERAYAEQGLERAPDAGEPPDYIGVELEFLLFLTRHELAARTTDDGHALRAVLESERRFVLNHAALWLPAFITQLRTADPGPVFAAAGDLLWAVIHDEVSRLSTGWSKPVASLEAD